MLGCAKSSAVLRMNAAQECADPTLRNMMVQGAVSCSEQAYETFVYMNQKGMYQVPTMKDRTQATLMHTYHPPVGGGIRPEMHHASMALAGTVRQGTGHPAVGNPEITRTGLSPMGMPGAGPAQGAEFHRIS